MGEGLDPHVLGGEGVNPSPPEIHVDPIRLGPWQSAMDPGLEQGGPDEPSSELIEDEDRRPGVHEVVDIRDLDRPRRSGRQDVHAAWSELQAAINDKIP